jgi:hypothetical protein
MAITAQELIVKSYYLSNVVSRDLDTITSSQIYNGLDLLNSILAMKTAKSADIPFYQAYPFIADIGIEEYQINGLVEPQILTFLYDVNNTGTPVRFPMSQRTREQYKAYLRPNNIPSLPYQWFSERNNAGSLLSIYFPPDKAYPFTLTGKFSLYPVNLNQDLTIPFGPSNGFPQYFIEYLRYELANMVAQDNGMGLNPEQKETLKDYRCRIRNVGPEDLTITLTSVFTPKIGDPYSQAGLARGWGP